MCVALLQPDEELIGIRRGESGYYRMYDGTLKGRAARPIADKMNNALGVTPLQREAMYAGSMIGWHIPAAHPECPLHAGAKPYAASATLPHASNPGERS